MALGAGGGRGLVHVGALLALEEQNLRPSCLVGSSVGALVAVMYAQQPDAVLLRHRIVTFLKSKTFQRFTFPVLNQSQTKPKRDWVERLSSLARQSILYGRAVTSNAIADRNALPYLLHKLEVCGNFSDLDIPVHTVSTVFPQGHVAIFSSGELMQPVAASMAIPTVFPPVNIAGQRYVDGGVYAEVPILQAKEVARSQQCMVAVNAGARRLGMHDPVNVLGVLDWVVDAQAQQLRERDCAYADVLVELMYTIVYGMTLAIQKK